MELIIKHEMDDKERKMSLNDAFMEALSLSEGRACKIEEDENDLEKYLKNHPDFINHIKDEYKISVLKGWNYEFREVEDINMDEKCDVCGKKSNNIKVGASKCGPMSFGYCPDCLKTKAEPYDILISYYAMADFSSYDEFEGIYKQIIDDTLKVTGKTKEQFNKDLRLEVEKIKAEYQ